MTKADKDSIASIILFFYFIYKDSGIKGVINAIKAGVISAWKYTKFLDFTSIQITGNSILVAAFATPITYKIVGKLLDLFDIKPGLFGKGIGKLLFEIFKIIISFILNLIGTILFKI